MTSADDVVLLCASCSNNVILQHWRSFEKQDAEKINAMQNMTIEQAHELRKVQLDLIFTKSLYMEFYGKITKRAYNIELNNLIRGDFNIDEVELNIPKLPPQNTLQEKYTPMLQLDRMTELYDAMKEADL